MKTPRQPLTLLIITSIFGAMLVSGAAIQNAKNNEARTATESGMAPPQADDSDVFLGTVSQRASGPRSVAVLVEMKDAPAAQVYAEIMADKTRPMLQRDSPPAPRPV